MTFKDIFPGLSRTKVIFQDFPGPGIFKEKNPGLSRRHGNPVYSMPMTSFCALCTVHMLIAKIVPVKYVTIGPRDPPFVTLLVKTLLNKRRCLRKNGRIDEANVLAEKNQSSYLGNS